MTEKENDSEKHSPEVPAIEEAIVTLQLLQIRERELTAKIRTVGERIEECKSELAEALADLDRLNGGFLGFIRKATLGVCLPPLNAFLLNSLNILLAELESYHLNLSAQHENGANLAELSERTPDEHNTIVLRKRAIAEFERDHDTAKLAEAEQTCERARKALAENDLSAVPEELLGEPDDQLDEKYAEASATTGKLSLSQHVDHVLLRIEKRIGNRTLPEYLAEKRGELKRDLKQRVSVAKEKATAAKRSRRETNEAPSVEA